MAGRWRASPYGGVFSDVKFGKSKKEPMFEHMKRPQVARIVTPGQPDSLKAEALSCLRDIPGPRDGENTIRDGMQAGDAVLEYWGKGRMRPHQQNELDEYS